MALRALPAEMTLLELVESLLLPMVDNQEALSPALSPPWVEDPGAARGSS